MKIRFHPGESWFAGPSSVIHDTNFPDALDAFLVQLVDVARGAFLIDTSAPRLYEERERLEGSVA